MTWLAFLGVALLVVLAGQRVAYYGDALAEKKGWGRAWVGLILVAATTSLPELLTGTSAALQGLVDIAVGDVLGSTLFNLLILSLLDAVGGRVPLLGRLHAGHALAVGFALLFLSLQGAALFWGGPVWGPVGWYSPLALALYLLATRLTFLYERRRPQAEAERLERLYERLSLAQAARGYVGFGALVVLGASLLPTLAERLAEETGLGASFVGTALVGAVTSLPEVAVTLSAARLGAFDLAVGNLLGSNLFNALILAWDDLLYPGAFFPAAHESHLAAVLVALAMYGVVLLGMSYQALRKLAVLSWDTLALLGLYLLGLLWLYSLR
ncbi:Sodium/calcium exchanger membrane region [Thermus sp. CCB_US3_UF1]|uniref:sodium:calcium antiporter n=1 Tax=Thermus sp. CCB_US3_UF1 TaxID=1111069 RepID=UPI00023898D2|nr:sodium/hydrogen exchanger [Thermus sp. CCB_US3_UF1]AEV16449.1 Sodium/calcium exchanger membrane region [Thermus sp. CCB_US3_UF1]